MSKKEHNNMKDDKSICFVCKETIENKDISINKTVNLPVCRECLNTDSEQRAEKEAIDSLGEDFVCGCI